MLIQNAAAIYPIQSGKSVANVAKNDYIHTVAERLEQIFARIRPTIDIFLKSSHVQYQFDQTERQFSARIHQPSTFDGIEVYSFFVLYWLLEQYIHILCLTLQSSLLTLRLWREDSGG